MAIPIDDVEGFFADGAANDHDEREQVEQEKAAVAAASWEGIVQAAPAHWYTSIPPKRAWLLRDARTTKARGVFPLGKVGQAIAGGGVGKTMALCQLAVAVNTGTPWLGVLSVPTPGRVLLVLGEEDTEECQRRLYRAARAAGAAPAPGGIEVMPMAGVSAPMIVSEAKGEFSEGPFTAWLRDYAKKGDFRLVVIDPLSRYGGREAEKDNAAATRFVQACESIATPTMGVLVAHHVNQLARRAGEMDATAARGVTGLVDGPRWQCAFAVERVKLEAAEERARLGEIVTWSVTKSNYATMPDPIMLRRDQDHGGALVPLDAEDLAALQDARTHAVTQTPRATARQAQAADKERREDLAVLEAVRERPGITARKLREPVKAKAKCGSDRADVAIERARAWLDVRPSKLRDADGDPIDTFHPPADEWRLPDYLRGR